MLNSGAGVSRILSNKIRNRVVVGAAGIVFRVGTVKDVVVSYGADWFEIQIINRIDRPIYQTLHTVAVQKKC